MWRKMKWGRSKSFIHLSESPGEMKAKNCSRLLYIRMWQNCASRISVLIIGAAFALTLETDFFARMNDLTAKRQNNKWNLLRRWSAHERGQCAFCNERKTKIWKIEISSIYVLGQIALNAVRASVCHVRSFQRYRINPSTATATVKCIVSKQFDWHARVNRSYLRHRAGLLLDFDCSKLDEWRYCESIQSIQYTGGDEQ